MTSPFKSREQIEALAVWLLDQCKAAGASDADILYSCGTSHELCLRDGEPEESTSGNFSALGVRTLLPDGRQGIAYGNRLDRESLAGLVHWSLHNCKHSEPEEGISLYHGGVGTMNQHLHLYDPEVLTITPLVRMEHCQEMTSTAKKEDSRVVSVRSASWSDGWGESLYATSAGFLGWRDGTSASCHVTVVFQDGETTEMGGYGQQDRSLAALAPILCAKKAVKRTSDIFGGKPIPTGRYTVLFDPETTSSLIDEIAELFCASDVYRGHSMLAGRLGTSVASSSFSLVDDGTLPGRMGTSPFDAEGVPTRRTVLVDKGVACSYLYNLQYAQKDGVASTGNASRGMSSLPDVGTSNLILEAGISSQGALIESVQSGFLVTELMGLHTLDPVSGDFSLGAKGIEIKKGVLSRPVSGVTIAGNLLELLNKVVAVGNDFEFFGSTGACTLVVDDIAVAGQ